MERRNAYDRPTLDEVALIANAAGLHEATVRSFGFDEEDLINGLDELPPLSSNG